MILFALFLLAAARAVGRHLGWAAGGPCVAAGGGGPGHLTWAARPALLPTHGYCSFAGLLAGVTLSVGRAHGFGLVQWEWCSALGTAGGQEAHPIAAIDDTWLAAAQDEEPRGGVPPCTGAQRSAILPGLQYCPAGTNVHHRSMSVVLVLLLCVCKLASR
jgi:hypothetical protein